MPVERAWHLAGQRWSTPKMPQPWPPDQPRLGRCSVMLGIGLRSDANIVECTEFYRRLGLRAAGDADPYTYWVEMSSAENPDRCSLILRDDPGFVCALYFRGADVDGWQQRLAETDVETIRLAHLGAVCLHFQNLNGNLIILDGGA